MNKSALTNYRYSKSQLAGAALTLAVVISALLFSSLRSKEVDQRFIAEMEQIQKMISAAPKEGDFDISFPSNNSEKDINVMRIGGKVSAVFRNLNEEDCRSMARAALNEGFDVVMTQRTDKSMTYEVGAFDSRQDCHGGVATMEIHQR